MSITSDELCENLFNDIENINGPPYSPLPPELLDEFSKFVNANSTHITEILSQSPDIDTQTQPGFSPENNPDSNNQELSSVIPQAAAFPPNIQTNDVYLKLIAEPTYGSKLRYRRDYEKNENRLGVLKNKNLNSNYQGPAISIPQCYLDPKDQYYIRVSLVTAVYDKTNLRYFHPYELEDPKNEHYNDKQNNVWYPIQPEDRIAGIKCFSSLRIVKHTASNLQKYGDLRVFDCHGESLQNHHLQQLSKPKETISEYNLEKTQLAFTIGKDITQNGVTYKCIYPNTTVMSDEMIEGVSKDSDGDNDTQSSVEKAKSSPPICKVSKYSPRYSFANQSEDMLILLTKKPEPKNYGDLQVTFQCNMVSGSWSQVITDLDTKDRTVSFKTPIFPYSIETTMPVDVILRQGDHDIGILQYFYLSTDTQCLSCQANSVKNQTNIIPNVPQKRSKTIFTYDNFENDGVVPVHENTPELRQSLSEPLQETSLSSSSSNASNSASLPTMPIPPTTTNSGDKVMDALANSTELLFLNNDFNPFLRICRIFIQKRPQLLFDALNNGHVDLLLKFIPIASIKILQQKNKDDETILLHAIRLNCIDIIKALLIKNDSEKLLDVDKQNNNIFHILASNTTSQEIVDLLINYFLAKSIPIQKFDHYNQDNKTPLQVAIYKNNLLVTKSILKYFNTDIYETKKRTCKNLIHLAVEYADLTMVKYLIEEEKLIKQGNQSNLLMTPMELAKSLERNDIVEYLNEKYPQEKVNEDDSSEDD